MTTLSRAQVRNHFSDVTDRVTRSHEEIHFGTRGEDEITMIASSILREIKRLAQKGAAMEAQVAAPPTARDPWAGFKERVRMDARGEHPTRSGRRLPADFDPHAEEETVPSWDEMVASGSRTPVEMEFVRRRRQ